MTSKTLCTSHVNERKALMFAMAAVFLWSTVATGFKLGLEHLAVSQLLFLGTFISWTLFAAATALRRKFTIARNEWAVVGVLGLINPYLYYLVLFEAYHRLPAQIAQPLNYTWAITLALLAVPILKQRLAQRSLAGIVVSYFGVLVLLSRNPLDASSPLDTLGIALAFASTLLWALYWLFNTRCRSDPLAVMFVSFSLGLVPVTATCALGPGLPVVNSVNLFYGAWVGLIEMGVTFLLWQNALKLTANVGRIGQLIFLAPFISLMLINTVLGEPVYWTSILGLALIVAGLWVTRI